MSYRDFSPHTGAGKVIGPRQDPNNNNPEGNNTMAINQPPQAPPAYSPQYAPAPARPTVDGLAVASMVLGIIWLWWIGSILAVIFGGVAIKRINASNGWKTGKGMAIAGLVLGLVGMGTLLLVMIAAAGAPSS